MKKTLVIRDEKAVSLLRNYVGRWQFSYCATYVLSFHIIRDAVEVELCDDEGSTWILSHLKSSEWFTELFAFDSQFEDSMNIRIYPPAGRRMGIEVAKITPFIHKCEQAKITDEREFVSFETVHGCFPDWIQGEWYNVSLDMLMSIVIGNNDTISICIEHEDPERITIDEAGFIGHSGIYMSLDCKIWLDRPILYEFVFDAHLRKIFCIMKMMAKVARVQR